MTRARIGCSGWDYADWRGDFYPPRLPASERLRHYAARFDTVEVNSTFYRLAKRDAVARWVDQVPDGFCFAVKASRYLTHIKRLTDIGRGLERFYAPLAPLIDAGMLGPVLWQLPATFHRDDDRLAALLDALRSCPPGRHCLEVRHPSWLSPNVDALLAAHGAALVAADRKGEPAAVRGGAHDWAYVRFHHGRQGRRGNYSDRELEAWASRIRGWQERGADVLAYFNNDWEGFAPRNAQRLGHHLSRITSTAR